MSSKALVLATAIDSNGGTTSTLMHGRSVLGETTETGLVLHNPEALSYEQYEEIGRLLGTANRRLAWVVGDWINAVEDVYPDRYSQAAEATRLSPQTIANRASVCRHIPPERRVAGLAFGVHAELAYMQPVEQMRWLKKAAKEDWGRAELRENMKAERGELPPAGEPNLCPCCGQTKKEER